MSIKTYLLGSLFLMGGCLLVVIGAMIAMWLSKNEDDKYAKIATMALTLYAFIGAPATLVAIPYILIGLFM